MPGTFSLITLQTNGCFLYCVNDLIKESRLSSGPLYSEPSSSTSQNHTLIIWLYSLLKETGPTLNNIHLIVLKKMGQYLYLK